MEENSTGASGGRDESLAQHTARLLRVEIDAGRHPPGEMLPSVRELGAKYFASDPVLREALWILTVEGRVRTIKGKGTLVLPGLPPQHLIEFDPEHPWRELTPSGPAQSRYLAATARLAALLGIARNDPIRIVDQPALHRGGARVRTRKALVIDRVVQDGPQPDLAGTWQQVVDDLTRIRGALRVHDRYGSAMADTDDHAALGIMGWPALVLSAAALLHLPAGPPVLAAVLHVDATKVELAPARR